MTRSDRSARTFRIARTFQQPKPISSEARKLTEVDAADAIALALGETGIFAELGMPPGMICMDQVPKAVQLLFEKVGYAHPPTPSPEKWEVTPFEAFSEIMRFLARAGVVKWTDEDFEHEFPPNRLVAVLQSAIDHYRGVAPPAEPANSPPLRGHPSS